MPVLALQPYGSGQVLYCGTDNLWRWRKNKGEQAYNVFWGQVTGRLALTHLLGGAKRTQLSVDKQSYVTGDRVTVYARLYQEGFVPVTDPSVKASYAQQRRRDEGGRATARAARPAGDVPGRVQRAQAGRLRLQRGKRSEDEPAFPVTEPQFEPGETAMNEGQLREMAKRQRRGVFPRGRPRTGCRTSWRSKTEHVRTTVEAELWSSPLVFALIRGVRGAEWILRKKAPVEISCFIEQPVRTNSTMPARSQSRRCRHLRDLRRRCRVIWRACAKSARRSAQEIHHRHARPRCVVRARHRRERSSPAKCCWTGSWTCRGPCGW